MRDKMDNYKGEYESAREANNCFRNLGEMYWACEVLEHRQECIRGIVSDDDDEFLRNKCAIERLKKYMLRQLHIIRRVSNALETEWANSAADRFAHEFGAHNFRAGGKTIVS